MSIEQRWKVDQGSTTGVDGQIGGEAPKLEDANENSGRQQQQQLEQCVAGKFHFVDLAGSARVSKTGNRGERFKGTLLYMYQHVYESFYADIIAFLPLFHCIYCLFFLQNLCISTVVS